ncbi:hypothetical protein PsgB076_12274 [Pseudomonas savastanoi pv. glycinea str. B076]|nr:hypothetical protein PsgB076_12274 [Pseudomonas savastanoi pv. glycinea str. B076]PYD22731.1 hypothetical protein DND36_12485 [Pseudomonas savastanoi pv. glycinea]
MNVVDSSQSTIWQALYQFFVSTEVDLETFDHMAKANRTSDYKIATTLFCCAGMIRQNAALPQQGCCVVEWFPDQLRRR